MLCFKKRIGKIIFFLFGFLIIDSLCGFLWEPVNYYGHFTQIDLKEMENNIDTVFLGSSWTYLGYNCEEFDEYLDTVSFNAGSVGQTTIDSYFYLKEILKKNPVKTVFYNISHLKLQSLKNRYSSTVVNDRLSGANRLKHLLASSDSSTILYFLKSFRYRENISSTNLFANVEEKLSPEYQKGIWIDDSSGLHYKDRGYIESSVEIPAENNSAYTLVDSTWRLLDIKEYNLEYLNKIVDLCQQENTRLIFITPPFSLGFLQATTGYQDYVEYMRLYTKEKNLEFIDFNRLKDNPFVEEYLFTDTTHLNTKGASILTEMLASYMLDGESLEFYDSIEERPELYSTCGGVSLQVYRYNDDIFMEAKAANTTQMEVEYSFEKFDASENSWISLSDYSKNNTLVLEHYPKLEEGDYYYVECRVIGSQKNREAYATTFTENSSLNNNILVFANYDIC